VNQQAVYIISIMKSGISSATQFLKDVGYEHAWPINTRYGDYLHWFEREEPKEPMCAEINHPHFFSDQPIFLLWKEFHKVSPDSKFIFTDRPADDWCNSFLNHNIINLMKVDSVNNMWNHFLKMDDFGLLKLVKKEVERDTDGFLKGCVYEESEDFGGITFTKFLVNSIKKSFPEEIEKIKQKYVEHNKQVKDYFKDNKNFFYSPLYEVDSNKLIDFLNPPSGFNRNIKWGHHNKTKKLEVN
jgi:hypothetical protein